MNLTTKIIAATLLLSSTLSFANENSDSRLKIEDKTRTYNLERVLPKEITVSETPALVKETPVKARKYSPEQKAAISGLKLSSISK
jgi:hypothetical protein